MEENFNGDLTSGVIFPILYDGHRVCRTQAYIDDLIVHGKTEEELVENLRRFFTRLREYGIKFNPAKSVLGVEVIEYVRHAIDGEGMHFSNPHQRKTAAYFPRPSAILCLSRRKLCTMGRAHASGAYHA